MHEHDRIRRAGADRGSGTSGTDRPPSPWRDTGVQSLVVERRRELSGLPRATGISTRTMEMLRSWGLEDEVRGGGVDVEWTMWSARRSRGASTGSERSRRLPTRAAERRDQPHLSRLRAAGSPGVGAATRTCDRSARTRAFGTEVVAVESDADGVRAIAARGRDRPARRRCTLATSSAADGAHSTVRTALGIAMHGPDRLDGGSRGAVPRPALGHARRPPLRHLRHHAPRGRRRSSSRPVRGDRWIYGVLSQPGREPVGELTADGRRRADPRSPRACPTCEPRIERIGVFTLRGAARRPLPRTGSAFLVGDAAHRVTPARRHRA